MKHSHLRTAGIVVTGGLLLAAVVAPSALAAKPTGHSVTICHATHAGGNPYVQVIVDVASAGYQHAGHEGHSGPVYTPELEAQGGEWGDIIPAYAHDGGSFPGLNNTGAGLEIWLNDCVLPAGATDPGTSGEESPSGEALEQELQAEESPTEETPTDETPTQDTEADPFDPGDGEIVIDGPFVTPTPASTPVGEVLGATGRPEMTPPATDTLAEGVAAPGGGLQVLLLAVAGLSMLVLTVGRVPAARRS